MNNGNNSSSRCSSPFDEALAQPFLLQEEEQQQHQNNHDSMTMNHPPSPPSKLSRAVVATVSWKSCWLTSSSSKDETPTLVDRTETGEYTAPSLPSPNYVRESSDHAATQPPLSAFRALTKNTTGGYRDHVDVSENEPSSSSSFSGDNPEVTMHVLQIDSGSHHGDHAYPGLSYQSPLKKSCGIRKAMTSPATVASTTTGSDFEALMDEVSITDNEDDLLVDIIEDWADTYPFSSSPSLEAGDYWYSRCRNILYRCKDCVYDSALFLAVASTWTSVTNLYRGMDPRWKKCCVWFLRLLVLVLVVLALSAVWMYWLDGLDDDADEQGSTHHGSDPSHHHSNFGGDSNDDDSKHLDHHPYPLNPHHASRRGFLFDDTTNDKEDIPLQP